MRVKFSVLSTYQSIDELNISPLNLFYMEVNDFAIAKLQRNAIDEMQIT